MVGGDRLLLEEPGGIDDSRCLRDEVGVVDAEGCGGDAAAVDLQSLAPDAPPITTLLIPFDAIAPHAVPERWRSASRGRLRHVVATLDGSWPEVPLAALSGVLSVPWPHQLVPALALRLGRGVRTLVADDVGLGNTLAAGLAIAELARRNLAARGRVLTPAGLRDQW